MPDGKWIISKNGSSIYSCQIVDDHLLTDHLNFANLYLNLNLSSSSLNNFAFHLENCRFACAIYPKCKGLEYIDESLCSLLMTVNASKMTRQLGTLSERKPDECVREQSFVDPVGYPYGLAIADIIASLKWHVNQISIQTTFSKLVSGSSDDFALLLHGHRISSAYSRWLSDKKFH